MTVTERGEKSVDLEAALGKVAGDRALLAELAELFCRESPKLLSAMRQAIEENDAPAIRAAAHSLKGSLGIFAAKPAAHIAARLEICAEAGQLVSVPGMFAELEAEVEKVRLVLQDLNNTGPPGDNAPRSAKMPATETP